MIPKYGDCGASMHYSTGKPRKVCLWGVGWNQTKVILCLSWALCGPLPPKNIKNQFYNCVCTKTNMNQVGFILMYPFLLYSFFIYDFKLNENLNVFVCLCKVSPSHWSTVTINEVMFRLRFTYLLLGHCFWVHTN